MDDHQIDQLLSDRWKYAVSTSCQSLERDDLRHVSVFNSWDDLQTQIAQGQGSRPSQQEFAMLTPGLSKLKDFTHVWMKQWLLDTSIFWGLVGLTIKLAQDNNAAAIRISAMLRELCHKVSEFNENCTESQQLTSETKELCVETALSLLTFITRTVAFLRSDVEYTTPGDKLEKEWQPLAVDYYATLRALDGYIVRAEKQAKLRNQSLQSVSQSSSTSLTLPQPPPDDEAKLPCIILPTIRTSRFFNRDDVLIKIEAWYAQADLRQTFRSLAVHGLGGLGKTSVALKFCEAKLRRNELDALFWVHAETAVSIQQSFTDIAMRLKLPDARRGDHEENRALVLSWLQTTQCRWLIIYDNAEDVDLITSFWPATSRGQALITTRNHTFAFEPADGGLELATWDDATGSKFLLHLLSTNIAKDLEAEEATSAQELSTKLSGHALAISTMAGLIHRKAWSIAEFLKIYNQRPGDIHGISGNSPINAVWDLSFKSLDANSKAILGVLCYFAPDSIPQSLFEESDAKISLPDSLAFCADYLRFSDVFDNLLTLALIKRDKTSRTFSLHRLVQTSFKYSMTPEQRQECFNDAAILVSRVYPRRGSMGSSNLYLMWERCSFYLQHVLSLRDCFKEERKTNSSFTAPQTYCDLNNACQRYLLEICSYKDLGELIEVNTAALKSLPEVDQTVGLQGSLTSHTGQLHCHLGRAKEGVEWLKKSYDIRAQDVPFNHIESSWAAENAALGLATINDFPAAIEWHEKSYRHWLDWHKLHGAADDEFDRGAQGTACLWAGDLPQARIFLMDALRQVEATQPYQWADAALIYFALGNLKHRERAYDAAETHFMEAQNAWSKGDQFRTAPFNAACMYKMGCSALGQGKLEAAIKHLRDARAVTQMRQDILVAEHARTLFMLSEALEQDPRSQAEAPDLREEAERILRLHYPQVDKADHASTYDDLVFIEWR